jgi:hypothetical protein
MKITSDLTNLRTAILIFTVQMFFEWTFRRNIRVLEFKLYCNKTNEAPELDLE